MVTGNPPNSQPSSPGGVNAAPESWPPKGGKGGGGKGKVGTDKYGNPIYSLPNQPDQTGSNLALTGQYADQLTSAQRAFQDAQAQLAQSRQQTYGALGMNNQGGWNDDPTSQYGQLTQQQNAAANTSQENLTARGLQGGAAATQAALDKNGRDAQMGGFLQNVLGQTQTLDQQGVDNVNNLTAAGNAARQGQIQYNVDNGLFTNAADQLSKQQVSARVAKLAQAWGNTFGKGTKSTNKQGQSYQQWLDQLASSGKLYNANASYGIGHTNYKGGA